MEEKIKIITDSDSKDKNIRILRIRKAGFSFEL